ncbi:5-dehydro-4-deoxy-D-glucuronate isomerase [Simiduia curdlanivorans]|uniref:4-deoxy-L-threo-5-hexosulose-uronate ketol-isomerase n=1 Tax=Simiduia curdlanivorans TaxID=1492769 RepID=A0ABV8V8E7_9GAMM|nr:5-dehydro-4-deoxy-D-glucuronate isomerase [Simiduia curdlanivorans]MDN3639719.1 5-dehydro-4-deoxy-D-glucuronate isomerase [Simiduia curdlanivorans]
MELNIRYANHPDDVKHYTSEQLREHFLVESLFLADQVKLTYSHVDRIMVGGIMPVQQSLTLEAGKEMGVEYFFERREAGIINVGGKGAVVLDGVRFELGKRDGLYVGMGVKDIQLLSDSTDEPAKFYFNSAPAHQRYPHAKIEIAQANPVKLGSVETSNKRTIYQYVHPAVCQSCQLVMGLTMLEPGSIWNTMPCHTHERRMEVYFYFDMADESRVFHLMGRPDETRHIVVANEQAVISPSWSIHSGAGTSNYTFIWGMVGENQTFDDMDHLKPGDLR